MIENFIKNTLKIDIAGSKKSENEYVIDLATSNDFDKIYSIIDSNDKCELDGDSVEVSEEGTQNIYYCDGYSCTLKSDFEKEKYTLIIKKEEVN